MIWLVLCLLVCTGCGRSYEHYLDNLRAEARSQLEHGELPRAYSACRRGLFLAQASGRVDLEWKFRVIQAEVEIQRSQPAKAQTLLLGGVPASLEKSETALLVNFERGAACDGMRNDSCAWYYFDGAEQLARLPGNQHWSGAIQSRRGTLAMHEGNNGEAVMHYLDAIRFAKDTQQAALETSALTSLGVLLMQGNQFGPAIERMQPAISLARRLHIKTLLERNLGNLGWCFYSIGELDSALASFAEAESVAGEINLENDQRRWLTGSGLVYSALTEYQKAGNYYIRALDLARRAGDPGIIADSLHNLAMNALDNRNLEAAQKYNSEEVQLRQRSQDDSKRMYTLFNQGRIEDGLKNYQAAEKTFREVAGGTLDDPSLRWQALCWLAGTHIEEGKGQQARRDYEDAIKTFDETRQRQGRDEFKIAFRAGVNRYYSPYIRFLMNAGNQFDALSVAELSRAQVLSERLGVDAGSRLDLPKIQASAAALHATILSYWLAEKASYLWVVTPTDFIAITLPEASEINKLAEGYRRSVASSSHATDTRLYETLIAPAQKYIAPGSRVVVIPDAGLFLVNFETLLVPGNPQPHYWIEDVVLSTATSLSLLSARQHANGKGNVLLIGNSFSPSPEFPALPYSATEIQSIEARFPEKQRAVYEGKEAVPSVYEKARPEYYSWIHFAAHGTASKESPLESAIILSNEGDSYKLYARDIAKHPLTADLVTISACYGSGTRTYAGEGIIGLAWAFLLAGAHNVIASLWEANDHYTAQLMDKMYEGLKAGDDPAHSLRTAKLSLLHSQYVCRNPRYWGAFQLYTGY